MLSLLLTAVVLGLAASVLASLPMWPGFRRFCYTLLALIFLVAVLAALGFTPNVQIKIEPTTAPGVAK